MKYQDHIIQVSIVKLIGNITSQGKTEKNKNGEVITIAIIWVQFAVGYGDLQREIIKSAWPYLKKIIFERNLI